MTQSYTFSAGVVGAALAFILVDAFGFGVTVAMAFGLPGFIFGVLLWTFLPTPNNSYPDDDSGMGYWGWRKDND